MTGFHITGSGTSYFVMHGDATIAGPYGQRWAAEAALDDYERNSKMRVRNCMTCAKKFDSEGPHNRMCDPCRAGQGDMGMVA